MKGWQKGAVGAGTVGLFFGIKELLNKYLDYRLKKVSCYPAPEGASIPDKIKLIASSPYKPKKYQI